MAQLPGWLSGIFGPTIIWINGVLSSVKPRDIVNFVGEDGVTVSVVDDAENNATRFVLGFDAGELDLSGIELDGDVSGALDATVVEKVTGAGGVVEIATTGAVLRWVTATTAPKLHQADNTTNSATGQPLTLQAQNATGTTATGGELRLTSGTGTSAAGDVVLQTGGTARLTIKPTSYVAVCPTWSWEAAVASPAFMQADLTTNSATGQALKIQAQNATGTTATGGQLTLTSGTGTSAAGNVAIQTGGSTRITFTPTSFSVVSPTWAWLSSVVAPVIQQNTDSTNSVTGDALTIQAQNCSGTTSTGGALNLTSGTGTSANGAVNIQTGGTTRFEITDSKTRWLGTRVRVHDIVSEVQTSSTSQTTGGSFTMADETLCTVDIVVSCARRTNVTKGGRYKRSVVYRRTGGAGPTIVGSLETGTDQETTAGDDVTIDVSSNDIRARVTAADSDPRNWTVHMVVHEQLST